MTKLVQLFKRKPGTSHADFRVIFREYGNRLNTLAEKIPGSRAELTVTLAVSENIALRHARGTLEPFDAMAELWFEDESALLTFEEPEMKPTLDELRAFQERSFDLSQSSIFFAGDESKTE